MSIFLIQKRVVFAVWIGDSVLLLRGGFFFNFLSKCRQNLYVSESESVSPKHLHPATHISCTLKSDKCTILLSC
eukprot:TRINITY_DN17094_c0_g1_i1.p1 TRINITY_DN17094_c0_g1~~TRINITY_DN17094_c0_g1_i1.p1  ORF type:complete len:74 (-),score=3.33 TRINITY_DN17094_c0_g1_i1:123-344(-)